MGPQEPRRVWQEVEVEYELVIEDYVAFNMHHIRRTPAYRKQRVVVLLIALAIAEVANGLLLYNQAFRGPLAPDAIFFHGGIALVFLVVFGGMAFRAGQSGSNSWMMKRMLRNVLTQGDPAVMIGKRRVRVTPSWLEEISDLRETRLKLQCVQRIDVTPEYAFVYVAPVMAFIIPVRAFGLAEHFATFIANLEGHTGKVAERFKN